MKQFVYSAAFCLMVVTLWFLSSCIFRTKWNVFLHLYFVLPWLPVTKWVDQGQSFCPGQLKRHVGQLIFVVCMSDWTTKYQWRVTMKIWYKMSIRSNMFNRNIITTRLSKRRIIVTKEKYIQLQFLWVPGRNGESWTPRQVASILVNHTFVGIHIYVK